MAQGPNAAAATPQPNGPVQQETIETGTPVLLSSQAPIQPTNKRTRHAQTEPIARPDLQQAGRPHKAPHRTGLHASIYTQSNQTATDSLTQVLGEQDRRLNAKRSVLKLIARSLDNVVATCDNDLKGPAEEIIGLFTRFLKATVIEPDNLGAHIPAPNGKTWAQIINKTHGGNPSEPPITQRATNQKVGEKSEDLRIFARIPEEHREWTKQHTSFALRHTICKQLDIPISDVPDVHHIATGLAIRPKDQATRSKILAKRDTLDRHLKAEIWYNYAVPHCPDATPDYTGGEPIATDTLMAEEVFSQTRTKPRSVRPSKHTPANATTTQTGARTWIVSFLHPVKPFRLFGTSDLARTIKKKFMPSRHSPGCQGYHELCMLSPWVIKVRRSNELQANRPGEVVTLDELPIGGRNYPEPFRYHPCTVTSPSVQPPYLPTAKLPRNIPPSTERK